MRLLNAKTLKVEKVNEKIVPSYAILSHRWHHGNEPTLQNMQKGTAKSMGGYAKIRWAAKQALTDGLDFIWIDTVCIDKTDSGELSESINSMYRWYADSDRCYAYLDDVVALDTFTRSKWFTRGWTLQELLAPRHVFFYSSRWIRLGEKKDQKLRRLLRIATEIVDDRVFYGFEPDDWSIAKRMSWAARRQTEKIEDIAYCLIGIFKVNMPMLYGEGGNAFIRLQKEIMEASNDHSIFAWTAPEACHASLCGLLATSPAQFGYPQSGVEFHDWMPSDVAYNDEDPTPFSMTNRGIAIDLPLVPVNPELPSVYYALLGYGPIEYRPAIIVTRLYKSEFARIRADRIITADDIQNEDGNPFKKNIKGIVNESEISPIYIKQRQPVLRNEFWGERLLLEYSQMRNAGFLMSEIRTGHSWDHERSFLYGENEWGDDSGTVAEFCFKHYREEAAIDVYLIVWPDGSIDLYSLGRISPPLLLGKSSTSENAFMKKIVVLADGWDDRVVIVTACIFSDSSDGGECRSILLQAFYKRFSLTIQQQRFLKMTRHVLSAIAAMGSLMLSYEKVWRPVWGEDTDLGSVLYSVLPLLILPFVNIDEWLAKLRELGDRLDEAKNDKQELAYDTSEPSDSRDIGMQAPSWRAAFLRLFRARNSASSLANSLLFTPMSRYERDKGRADLELAYGFDPEPRENRPS